jgi:hypothetical protein
MSEVNNQTKNSSLQLQLQQWDEQISSILALDTSITTNLSRKQQLLDSFVRSFVPLDVDEEDVIHYQSNLLNDEEFFQSLAREIHQCVTGERVEEILGDKRKKQTFILLPPLDVGKLSF